MTPEAIVSIMGGIEGMQYIAYSTMAIGFFRALVSITSTLAVGLTTRYYELRYLHSVMQADLLNGRYDIRSAADRYASAVFPVYSVMNRTVAGANGGGLAVCLYVMGVAAVYAAQGLFIADASIYKLLWLFFIMMSLFILPLHLLGIALCTGVSEDFVAWCNTELRQVILRGGLTSERNTAAKAAFASALFGTSPQVFLPEIMGIPTTTAHFAPSLRGSGFLQREHSDSPSTSGPGAGVLEASITAGDVSPMEGTGTLGFTSSARGDEGNPLASQPSGGEPAPGARQAPAMPTNKTREQRAATASSAASVSSRDRSSSSGRARAQAAVSAAAHAAPSIDDTGADPIGGGGAAAGQAGASLHLPVAGLGNSNRMFGSGVLSTVDETGREYEYSRSAHSSSRSAAMAYSAARGGTFLPGGGRVPDSRRGNSSYGIIWEGSPPPEGGGAGGQGGAAAPHAPYGGGLLFDAVHDIEFARYDLREGVGALFRPASMMSMGGVSADNHGLRDRRRFGGTGGPSPVADATSGSYSDDDAEQLIAGRRTSELFDSDEEDDRSKGWACCRTNVPADGRMYRSEARTASQVEVPGSASSTQRCCPDLSTNRLLYKGQRRGTRMLFHFADMLKNVQLVRFTDGSMLATVQSTLATGSEGVTVVLPAPPSAALSSDEGTSPQETPRGHVSMPGQHASVMGMPRPSQRPSATVLGQGVRVPVRPGGKHGTHVREVGGTPAPWEGTQDAVRADFDSDSTVSAPKRPVLLSRKAVEGGGGSSLRSTQKLPRKENTQESQASSGDPAAATPLTIHTASDQSRLAIHASSGHGDSVGAPNVAAAGGGGVGDATSHPRQLLSSEHSISPGGSVARRVTALAQHASSGSLQTDKGGSPPRHSGEQPGLSLGVSAARTDSPMLPTALQTGMRANSSVSPHLASRGNPDLSIHARQNTEGRGRRASATYGEKGKSSEVGITRAQLGQQPGAGGVILNSSGVSDTGGTLRFSSENRSVEVDSDKMGGLPASTRMGTMELGGGSFSTQGGGIAVGLRELHSDSEIDLDRVVGTQNGTAAFVQQSQSSEDSRAHDHSTSSQFGSGGSGQSGARGQTVSVRRGGPVTIHVAERQDSPGDEPKEISLPPYEGRPVSRGGQTAETGEAPIAVTSGGVSLGDGATVSIVAAARDDSETRMSITSAPRNRDSKGTAPVSAGHAGQVASGRQPSLGAGSEGGAGSAIPYKRPVVTTAYSSMHLGGNSLRDDGERSSTRDSSSDAAVAAAAIAAQGGMGQLRRKNSAYGTGSMQAGAGSALPSMFFGYNGAGGSGFNPIRRQVAWAPPAVAGVGDSRDGSIQYLESVGTSTGASSMPLPHGAAPAGRFTSSGSTGGLHAQGGVRMVSVASEDGTGAMAAAQLVGENLEHAVVDRQLAQLDSFIRFMQLAQQRGEATGTAFAGPLNVGGAMRLVGLCVSGIVIIINQGFSLYEAF